MIACDKCECESMSVYNGTLTFHAFTPNRVTALSFALVPGIQNLVLTIRIRIYMAACGMEIASSGVDTIEILTSKQKKK